MSLLFHKKVNLQEAYENYADMLFRVALANTGNKEDAEDAVHEAFAKYMTAPGFNDDEHEKAWLIRTTVNKCRDLMRKNQVREYTSLDDLVDLPIEDRRSLEGLEEKIKNLPFKLKNAVILFYLEGFSVEEISKMLRISASACKMRLSRGREALKEMIGEEE